MFPLLIFTILISSSWGGLYTSSSNVVELDASNFDKLVINSDEIWIVEFYAPWCGHCQQLVPEYQKAATALKTYVHRNIRKLQLYDLTELCLKLKKCYIRPSAIMGVIKVGAVNADEHQSLGGRYGVRGFPTIKIFGDNKNKPADYNGQRTAQGFVDEALSVARNKVNLKLGGKSGSKSGGDSKDVIELTDDNFDKLVLKSNDIWLIEFFAPWCGHCKNLEPHWAEAATELKGKVKLGALDATVHSSKAAQYGVRGYPTIKYFGAGPKTSDSVEEYDGGRTAKDIINWALDKVAENVPSPEITQILDEESFENDCQQKSLCVVSVLPHILDCQSKCRDGYLKILKDMGEKYKKKLWGWTWSEAGAQLELENALDIGGFGYPAMAVVNAKKMKYSLLRGAFSKDGINEFLRDLSYGRGNTAPVKGAELPKIVKTSPWDGKDGELPIEEELDLSDVDLDEKDEL